MGNNGSLDPSTNDFPGSRKTINLIAFPKKTIILVGIYNQQFQGTIILMVFDLQGFCSFFVQLAKCDK